ncbi:solute carrier organic anion transporter family member 4C1-like protein [Cricetulus griseus]|uniref:Solute carrier organic anion transporter family member 4C1-like protein n=1 Tax=Cricetulus griseus TaxID=10029 RepID=A0A061IGE8_CRIGR|nr:solute carrier organic anion transporter family member 4C1-like protein [Cricetulus griseus]
MQGPKGIENPAFVPSSPDTPRRASASPSQVEVSAVTSRNQNGDSQPRESEEPQKSSESPPPLSTPPASDEPPGSQLCELEEGPCGWRDFHPRCLQLCNTPQGFLFHYCLLALTQGIVVNGLVNISISTIEKRYEMKSSLTGLISSSYDISFCVLSLFVSFFGERGHKPRWLAFAAFMIGLGALVFSLPHFFSGRYELGSLFEDTCLTTRNSTSCESTSSLLSNYLYIFVLGQLLLGTGGTPLYTLGTAFIDDSVPTHKSSLYIGTAKIQAGKTSQTHQNSSTSFQHTDENFGKSIKDFPTAIKVYYNCSCIERKAEITSTVESADFEAKAGKCETHCANLPIFLGIFFITVIFTFMAGTPITVSILRCVNHSERSLALGVQFMLLRLIGTIPGPIIFGVTIDSTCVLWDVNECGIKGACWIYDNIRMAHMLVAISVTCKVITMFFNGLAIVLYKPPTTGTEASFQSQNVIVSTISIEEDFNKVENEG